MLKAWFLIKTIRVISAGQLGQRGFSPVEVLLAATVFGFLVTALIGAIVYGRTATAGSGDRAAAVQLADEGVQAVRNIRNAAFTNLVDGTYGIAQVSNQWALSGSSDVSGIYTRQVVIAANGADRKNVTSTVSWPQPNGSTAQVSVSSLLANWFAAVKSWAGAILNGSYDATGTQNGYKVDSDSTYAYLIRNVSGAANFFVINISNPAAPTLASSITLTGTPTNIMISGGYAYVSNSNTAGELQIINISNPAAPVLTATYNAAGLGGGGLSVFVSGNYAYLGRVSNLLVGELTIVNISNPASPTLAGSYGALVNMNQVWVSGNYAYLATSSATAQMAVLNISNPATPTLVATFNSSAAAGAASVTVQGSTAYLAAGNLITAVNVATPTAPAQLGTYTLTGTGIATDVRTDNSGNFLFVGSANTAAELRILNVATPSAITLAKTIDVAGTASTVSGLDYNSTLDVVLGASASDTQELLIYKKN